MTVSLVSPYDRWSFPAGSTALQQFQFVQLNASGQIVTPAVSGTGGLTGVLDDAPNNSTATLGANGMYSGGYTVGVEYGCVIGACVMKVIAGAALTPGQAVMTDANGHAIPQSGTGVTLGYAVESATSGSLVPIRLL